ncbi:MAG: hypothetical protein ACXADY_13655 [Candidatus Hodarchaeales archaeon]
MILGSLRLILKKFNSAQELYNEIKSVIREEKEDFSYSQFTRYLKGEIPIPNKNEDIFIRFLHNNFNLSTDLVQPNIDINIDATPIQIDMSRLLSFPDNLNLLAFHVIRQDHLRGKFDVILTHSEAIPLAIAFSQSLNIPWLSVTFRPPLVHPSRIMRYSYLIDQELVATAYFTKNREPSVHNLRNKRFLVISDYIRRGGFLDILFRVVEDNNAEVRFLLAILGIGNAWKRFYEELEGNMRVIHFG